MIICIYRGAIRYTPRGRRKLHVLTDIWIGKFHENIRHILHNTQSGEKDTRRSSNRIFHPHLLSIEVRGRIPLRARCRQPNREPYILQYTTVSGTTSDAKNGGQ